jgi:hypothetical protein
MGIITHIITYSVHNVLSWRADFQGMISEPNAICKVCADLALFGGGKNLSLMIRQLELELTAGTLTIAISVRLSERCPDILTEDRFMVKADHLVFQVKNTTTVCYTKRYRGCKPKGQSSWCDVYEACTLTAQVLPGARQHLQAFHAKE